MINGMDDETVRYYDDLSIKHNNFSYYQSNDGLRVGEARNQIIEKSTGKYLCFIDDDIELPNNYFVKAKSIISNNKNVDVFGGPDQTKENASDFQLILGEVMKSFFAMGPTAKRHRSIGHCVESGNEINLILCNLWMKKSIFNEGYNFPRNYIRNEENILLGQLKRNNKSLIYSSDLIVFHERKNSIKKLTRATYYSGVFRTYGFFDESTTFQWYFLIPQILLLLLVLSLFMSVKLSGLLVILYLMLITFKSMSIALKLKKLSALTLGMTFFLVYNFIYTIGMFSGYIKVLNKNE